MGKISLLIIATMFALVLAFFLQVDTVEAVPKGGRGGGGRGKFQTCAGLMLGNILPFLRLATTALWETQGAEIHTKNK